MQLGINLSPLVVETKHARSSARRLVVGTILRESLGLCMEVLVAATRQFRGQLYPLRASQDDSFMLKAAELQQILQAMPEYQVIACFGDEHQKRWANMLCSSIAEVPVTRAVDSVVLHFPTVATLRGRLRACLASVNA